MANQIRNAEDNIAFVDALTKEPWRFHFFATVRRFEQVRTGSQESGSRGIGRALSPKQDPVRFCQAATVAFVPRELDSLSRDSGHFKLNAYFSGLWGPGGPMPLHMTEMVLERRFHHQDKTLEAFADIFHHRFFSYLYRAWAANRPEVMLRRNLDDPFALYFGALSGLADQPKKSEDTEGLDCKTSDRIAKQKPAAFDEFARRFFVGFLSAGKGAPEFLAHSLTHYLGVKAKVVEFQGAWLDIPPSDRAQLGSKTNLAAMPALGQKYWSRSAQFEICLGPMSYANFQRFLPAGRSNEALRDMIIAYVGYEQDWRVRLLCQPDEIDGVSLGGEARLGLTSWLAPEVRKGPLDDLVLQSDRLKRNQPN